MSTNLELSNSSINSTISHNYSINLMWINAKPQDLTNEQVSTIAKSILGWASQNPQKPINFWYDSKMTSIEVINKTKKTIDPENKLQQLRFRDVRQLKIFQSDQTIQVVTNPKAYPPFYSDDLSKDELGYKEVTFSPSVLLDERVPVYLRVDALKTFISDQILSDGENDYAVYSDLDMPPITEGQLFDSNIKAKLNKFGFVMAEGNRDEKGEPINFYENGFFIMDGKDKDFMKAHKQVMIDIFLRLMHQKKDISCQIVHYLYKTLMAYVWKEKNDNPEWMKNNNNEIPPEEAFYSFSPRKSFAKNIERLNEGATWSRFMPFERFERHMPTIKSDIPISQFSCGQGTDARIDFSQLVAQHKKEQLESKESTPIPPSSSTNPALLHRAGCWQRLTARLHPKGLSPSPQTST